MELKYEVVRKGAHFRGIPCFELEDFWSLQVLGCRGVLMPVAFGRIVEDASAASSVTCKTQHLIRSFLGHPAGSP